MKFRLKITPIINPQVRDKIKDILIDSGYSIVDVSQGISVGEMFSNITFEGIDPRDELDSEIWIKKMFIQDENTFEREHFNRFGYEENEDKKKPRDLILGRGRAYFDKREKIEENKKIKENLETRGA